MRYLGIDYGGKRVGISLSDDTGRIAFPHKVIKNSRNLLEDILSMIEKEKIEAVVVGESLNFKGEPNVIMEDINRFAEKLKTEIKIPIIFEPEFLTSVQAEKLQPLKEMLDASAAALILQSYLDRKK